MRLIDIDDWKNKNEAFFGIGLEFDIDRVVETLNQMPTIEAIPIEWLLKWNKAQATRCLCNVKEMIKDWRKENVEAVS